MVHIPVEQDLRSNNPEIWANAVIQCKSGNPYCGVDGRCALGGDCFIKVDMTLEQALQEIQHLRKELDEERVRWNQVLALHSAIKARLKKAQNMALKQGKSERLFAIRQCLAVLTRNEF